MNDNSGDAYPAISPNSIPPGGQFPGGRNDETPFWGCLKLMEVVIVWS